MSTARMLPALVLPAFAAMLVLYGGELHAQEARGVEGVWIASQELQGQTLRSQLVITRNADGLSCTLDVIELNAWNVGCGNAVFAQGAFSFEVPVAGGRWQGRVSEDGSRLEGTWTQRNPPAPPGAMQFVRQQQRVTPEAPAPVSFDAALPPVEPAHLEAVLREDLRRSLETGALAPGKGVGIAIAVIAPGGRSVFTLGAARRDTVLEIGSLTKTFTGLALAQLIEQGKVRPDSPVRELLPAGTVARPAGAEITLHDLVTHHSGLPRLPDNMDVTANLLDPYAKYDAARLHAWLAGRGVARPADATLAYSNVGAGLLGHALARTSGQDYEQLVAEQVLKPLGMDETGITLSPERKARLLQPRDAQLAPVPPWEWDVLAGAGALRSTIDDMMKFLAAQLAPQDVQAQGASGRTLAAALRRAQQARADAPPGMNIAYAWLTPRPGVYYHDGGTGGFASFMWFDVTRGMGCVVLVNVSVVGPKGNFAEAIAQHVVQRLTGQEAISLARW